MNTVAAANSLVSAASDTSNSLVLFDSRLSDLDMLYRALLPNTIGHTIDATEDALVVITRLLAETGAKNLAIVAHGEPGVIHLGRESIDLAVLNARSGLFQEWCLDSISLYSCEVGADQKFVTQLGCLTGASISAATTKVGSADLGGCWELDLQGERFAPLFRTEKLKNYRGTMTVTVNLNNAAGIGNTDYTEQIPVNLFADPILTATSSDNNAVDVVTVNISGATSTESLSLSTSAASQYGSVND
jgi:Domain of unknown function (DUF4347)